VFGGSPVRILRRRRRVHFHLSRLLAAAYEEENGRISSAAH